MLGWCVYRHAVCNLLNYNDMNLLQSHEASCLKGWETISLTLACAVCWHPGGGSAEADAGALSGFDAA
jgi:hypothetical protein